MVAKKQAPATESVTESTTESTTVSTTEQAPEPEAAPAAPPSPAPEPPPEPTPEDAASAQPSDPTRAGGYVLTERGWEIDPAIAATPEQEG